MKQPRRFLQLALAVGGIALVGIGAVLVQPAKKERGPMIIVTKAEFQKTHRQEVWRKAAVWMIAGGCASLVVSYFVATE